MSDLICPSCGESGKLRADLNDWGEIYCLGCDAIYNMAHVRRVLGENRTAWEALLAWWPDRGPLDDPPPKPTPKPPAARKPRRRMTPATSPN